MNNWGNVLAIYSDAFYTIAVHNVNRQLWNIYKYIQFKFWNCIII